MPPQPPYTLPERGAAALLCLCSAVRAPTAARFAALQLLADKQRLPVGEAAALGAGEIAAEGPVLLAAAACVCVALQRCRAAAGLGAAEAQTAALQAVRCSACKVLGNAYVCFCTEGLLAATQVAAQHKVAEPSVYDHLTALHTQLQASGPQRGGAGACTEGAWSAVRLPTLLLLCIPVQADLAAFAAVELGTCCAILELLYSAGSPYAGGALSRGGKLMAGEGRPHGGSAPLPPAQACLPSVQCSAA